MLENKDGLFEYTKELEKMIEEMKQDNTYSEHNVELEKKLTLTGAPTVVKEFSNWYRHRDQVGEHISTARKHPLYQAK
jgi:hypothetical protein